MATLPTYPEQLSFAGDLFAPDKKAEKERAEAQRRAAIAAKRAASAERKQREAIEKNARRSKRARESARRHATQSATCCIRFYTRNPFSVSGHWTDCHTCGKPLAYS